MHNIAIGMTDFGLPPNTQDLAVLVLIFLYDFMEALLQVSALCVVGDEMLVTLICIVVPRRCAVRSGVFRLFRVFSSTSSYWFAA